MKSRAVFVIAEAFPSSFLSLFLNTIHDLGVIEGQVACDSLEISITYGNVKGGAGSCLTACILIMWGLGVIIIVDYNY